LLTGQIVSVDNPQLLMLVIISAVVIAALVVDLAPAEFRERGCRYRAREGTTGHRPLDRLHEPCSVSRRRCRSRSLGALLVLSLYS
jgi:hypothetical protein